MDRKAQRDTAYKLIFEYLLTGEERPYTLEILAEERGKIPEYVTRVFEGVKARKDELNAIIESRAESSAPLFLADRAALLLAAYEIFYEDDIPHAVSCSEAVELVKLYSTKKSPAYVNGILAAVGDKR